ncbi:sugar ABC transporter ATP-binding protein [Bacillota bacterium Meth-B3]
MSEYTLRMENVTKVFPGVRALSDITFEVRRGEIHALIGENGAGKSTLIKILAGIHQPDEGQIYLDDRRVVMTDVSVAAAAGISVIHQELSLAGNMTVAENIFLGKFPVNRLGFVDDRAMARAAAELLQTIGMSGISPDTRVSKLSVAQRQMIEICRSLSQDLKILVMDEPTASLAGDEVDTLLAIMRRLSEQGVTIIFISHKLDEIFRVCDRVTILRDGCYVGTRDIADITKHQIINMMVGREIENIYPESKTSPGEVFFEASHISSDRVKDISFNLRKGEVLGFYGLMGSGRSELMRALIGVDRAEKGEVKLDGKPISIRTPSDAVDHGIVLAPEDRKHEGLVMRQTVDFNVTIAILKRLIRFVRLDRKLSDRTVDEVSRKLKLKTASYETKALNLSGGNQQKVVLAKWLVTNPRILILDEPTKGIDVGAKQEIYRLIYEIVDMGVGIILISSEMAEIINLCDRVYVLREGRLVGAVDKENLTEQEVILYAVGGSKDA